MPCAVSTAGARSRPAHRDEGAVHVRYHDHTYTHTHIHVMSSSDSQQMPRGGVKARSALRTAALAEHICEFETWNFDHEASIHFCSGNRNMLMSPISRGASTPPESHYKMLVHYDSLILLFHPAITNSVLVITRDRLHAEYDDKCADRKQKLLIRL
jgi:hypothetical protein